MIFSSLHATLKQRRHLLLLLAMLPLSLFARVSSANSGTCSYDALYPAAKVISVPISGSITVGRDQPIGAVLYKSSYVLDAGTTGLMCTAGTFVAQFDFASTPLPKSNYVHPVYGAKVYDTNVPGIGIAFTNDNINAVPFNTTTNTLSAPGRLDILSGTANSIVLIKTANTVGAGTINGASLPIVRYSVLGSASTVYYTSPVTGAINIVSGTCTTPDVSVVMGDHVLDEINGIGSTTPWVNVPISLNNCPAFFGTTTTATHSSLPIQNTVTKNTVQYRVDPVTSIEDAAHSVMALRSDGVNATATGIGLQIAKATGVPVGFGVAQDSGLALTQVSGTSYTINLQARYYQTAANPTAGQANGAATVTLIYQ